MRIVLSMVGVALGIAIAAVAGVYGWQQYESSRLAAAPPATAAKTPPVAGATKPPSDEPKPVDIPATKPGPTQPTTTPSVPLKQTAPTPAQAASAMQRSAGSSSSPATGPTADKPAVPPGAAPVPREDKPIAVPETPSVATPEKLEQLVVGMSEDDIQKIMGKEGIATPGDELPAYTPEGWYEVRWPNADGSYIAALFGDRNTLVHVEPFNMPGAYRWMATPWYAVPNWLNVKLQSNNMTVRLPAVDVIEARVDTFQFRGLLVNADGQTLGSISGTYYVNDPNGRFVRAIEGTYEYALPNGRVDANTFQFTE